MNLYSYQMLSSRCIKLSGQNATAAIRENSPFSVSPLCFTTAPPKKKNKTIDHSFVQPSIRAFIPFGEKRVSTYKSPPLAFCSLFSSSCLSWASCEALLFNRSSFPRFPRETARPTFRFSVRLQLSSIKKKGNLTLRRERETVQT